MSNFREQLLKLTERRFAPAGLPGFPDLRVRSLFGDEREILERRIQDDPTRAKRHLMIACLCGPHDDVPIFTYADFDSFGSMDSSVLDAVAGAAMKIAKFSEQDVQSLMGERVAP